VSSVRAVAQDTSLALFARREAEPYLGLSARIAADPVRVSPAGSVRSITSQDRVAAEEVCERFCD